MYMATGHSTLLMYLASNALLNLKLIMARQFKRQILIHIKRQDKTSKIKEDEETLLILRKAHEHVLQWGRLQFLHILGT